MYCAIVVDHIKRISESFVVKKQGGFRRGRGCVDQIFAVGQAVERVLHHSEGVNEFAWPFPLEWNQK